MEVAHSGGWVESMEISFACSCGWDGAADPAVSMSVADFYGSHYGIDAFDNAANQSSCRHGYNIASHFFHYATPFRKHMVLIS